MTRFLLVFAVLCSLPVLAQDERPVDAEGSKDHPAVKRYPGAIINENLVKEFESFAFPLGDSDDGTVKTKTVEGKYYFAEFAYPASASVTQVLRNYENAFKAAGMAQHKGKSAPVERGWGGNPGWVSAEGRANGKGPELFILVAVQDNGGAPMGYTYVIEKAAMEQKVEIDAGAMADEIEKSGHIALYGINFASGKADITPDSVKTLTEIARLMELKQDWKLRVEGHTDNVGKAKANLELSKKRAAAVKDYLVKTGKVAAARLGTEGYGDTKPLAPNTTDDGKAKNRRVELAKL